MGRVFLMFDANKHKLPQKSRRYTMRCVSTGSRIVLHVTGFDKKINCYKIVTKKL
jgi:hypothetical protein